MHDYSGHEEVVPADAIKQLGILADKLDGFDSEIAELEDKLKALGESRRQVSEVDLPELMLSVGMKKLVTTSGLEVDLREEVRCSFPSKDKHPDKRKAAFAWLIDNNFENLIKHKVDLQFPKGDRDKADKVVAALEALEMPLNMTREDTVHHQTLLAFLREQIEEGAEVPLEMFGAFVQKFAKIKRAKAKK